MESSHRNLPNNIYDPSPDKQLKISTYDEIDNNNRNMYLNKPSPVYNRNHNYTTKNKKVQVFNSHTSPTKQEKDKDEGQKTIISNLELYEEEIKENKIPRKVKNITDISNEAKKQLEKFKSTLRKYDIMLCVFSTICIVSAILDQNSIRSNYSFYQDKFLLQPSNQILRVTLLILSLVSVLFVFLRYYVLLDIHKLKLGSIANNDNIYNAGYFFQLCIEIMINLIILPPNVENVYSIQGSIYVKYDYSNYFQYFQYDAGNGNKSELVSIFYSLSTILTLFILLRSYHFIRLIHTFSYWATPRAEAICKLMNTEATIGFGIKAYLKINPFLTLGVGILFVIFFFTFGIEIFEYYNEQSIELLIDVDSSTSFTSVMKKFINYLNCFWFLLVTMTTIGYGDMYATTYFGRILAVTACIFGTFVVSLLVVFLNNLISFDEVEKHIYNSIVDENKSNEPIKRMAGKLLFKAFLLNYLHVKKRSTTKLSRLNLWVEMNYRAKRFKLFRINNKKVENDIDDILGKIKYNFDNGIVPLKATIDAFNKERIYNDHSFGYLKESNQICENMLTKSTKLINLLKVLRQNKYLPGLKSIDEVYDVHANFEEEIIQYHKNYKINKEKSESPVSTERSIDDDY